LELKVKKRSFISVAYNIDGAASSTVTAIGTAERNKFFSAEAARSSPSVTCRNLYLDLIDKLHPTPLSKSSNNEETRFNTTPTAAALNRV
jgi:hypothetical protein